MSSYLSMMEARLPPGFRFHPRDDELICDYLTPKVISGYTSLTKAGTGGSGHGCNLYGFPMMIDVDLNKCEPWDLPEMACVGGKEWYFFNLRDRKYATGQRTNRATLSGYWKATGKDRQIVRKGILVGMRKTLVFYQGRAPKGRKTDWVMHEFRMEGHVDRLPKFSFKDDWVLCRVFYKSRGIGGGEEISSKPTSTESCYDDTGTSSLPPLTDTCNAFDQFFLPPPPPPTPPPPPPQNLLSSRFTSTTTTFEQVPCFSSLPEIPSQQFVPTMERSKTSIMGDFPKDLASSCFNPLDATYDKKVMNSVLDHLTKLEGNQQTNKGEGIPPSFVQLATSQNYLTGTALNSSIWYNFQS